MGGDTKKCFAGGGGQKRDATGGLSGFCGTEEEWEGARAGRGRGTLYDLKSCDVGGICGKTKPRVSISSAKNTRHPRKEKRKEWRRAEGPQGRKKDSSERAGCRSLKEGGRALVKTDRQAEIDEPGKDTKNVERPVDNTITALIGEVDRPAMRESRMLLAFLRI